MKYRKKPVVIEAVQWTGQNFNECDEFCHQIMDDLYMRTAEVKIHTLEGDMTVSLNDWIIKGVKGEFYPCKPDIFEATYDKVQE